MTPLELAYQYMSIVYESREIRNLQDILADDFKFRGPFFSFDSAGEYIQSLMDDPPRDFGYEMIQSYENDRSACLIYRFSKPGVSTIMSQLFETENEKIRSILLIFDRAAFR